MGMFVSRQLDIYSVMLKNERDSAKPDLERQGTFQYLRSFQEEFHAFSRFRLDKARSYDPLSKPNVPPTDIGGMYVKLINSRSLESDHFRDIKVEKPAIVAHVRVSDGVGRNKLDVLCDELRTADNDPDILSAIYGVPAGTYSNNPAICLDAFFHVLTKPVRQYVGCALRREWPFLPDNLNPNFRHAVCDMPQKLSNTQVLKKCVGYALKSKKYDMAVAMTLLLDQPSDVHGNLNLVADIITYVQEDQPNLPVPPFLIIRKAQFLNKKGEFHRAIKDLANILDNGKDKGCTWIYKTDDQFYKIRGLCVQLTGQILYHLSCWKDAICPLVESIRSFGCLPGRDTGGMILSLELISKCLCRVTNSDYQDIRELLGLQHDDRFYQAHVAAKEAVLLAKSAAIAAKCQNQSAEALIMYAARHEDPSVYLPIITRVLTELTASLAIHKSKVELQGRCQFFEYVRTIFLMMMALSFSTRPEDKKYAFRLEQTAFLLFGNYCRQLRDSYQKYSIEIGHREIRVINCLMTELGLEMIDPAAGGCGDTCIAMQEDVTPLDVDVTYSPFFEENSTSVTKRDPLEVGLPVTPKTYGIPVFDIPLDVFQDLSGYKVDHHNDVDTDQDTGSMVYSNYSVIRSHTASFKSEFPPLVDTFMPTYVDCASARESCDVTGTNSGVNSGASDVSSSEESIKALLAGPDSFSNETNNNRLDCSSTCVKKARLMKFNPVTGLWTSHTTLASLSFPKPKTDDNTTCRRHKRFDAHFLHQDEVLSRYVGKRYVKQQPPSRYLQDVVCQRTAEFLVTLFNYALQNYKTDVQVQFAPVDHLQILNSSGEIEEWLNIEPYRDGTFTKIYNNLDCSMNKRCHDLATALTHFTYVQSRGKLMLVDLQGWIPAEGKGVVFLTDPQFYTAGNDKLSSGDIGVRGMRSFWDKVHSECNEVCWTLNLSRPTESFMV
ncbi:alpha-protein kinase 1-like [Gigantopelta aegis]|uniref:alpha-protein kinase 1-like n=1 Tax=Gigantopelta aegis TaxID=1735272 RepID=UPI001B88AC9D|nr:alpha-protein kinase 1-like [Gigantopelta aegis]